MKPFCLALCLLLLTPMAVAQPAADLDHARRAGEAVLSQLLEGDYDGIVDRMADALKGMVTAQQLQTGWEAQLASLGAFQSAEPAEAAAQGEYFVVAIALTHERGGQLLTCAFDAEDRLASLTLTNRQAASAPDAPLPEGVTERPVTLFEGTDRALKGVLALPGGEGPFVAAVFAAGSGPSDQNEAVGANAPLRDLARGLAARGVASIRYEKPTYAHPEQFSSGASVKAEYTDALAEAALVLGREIDASRVYFVGHSLGAMLGPRLMREVGGFAGGALLAGSPRKPWEIVYDQNVAAIAALPQDSRAAYQAQIDEQLALAQALDQTAAEDRPGAVIFGMPADYLYDVCDGDAAAIALESGLPLFIAQGSLDFQVDAERDFGAWQARLGEDGPAQYHLYEGLNHLFIPSPEQGRGTVAEYNVPGAVSEALIDDLANWMLGA
ncbi:MAG: DUF3887 domain-containing protein [Clostridiales bacterium]|nr:DUF3887 domain-containing protein [Clostridiales bacterium]